jgi:ubiquinone/menaquinone biosynthesis C-methylase UbiE
VGEFHDRTSALQPDGPLKLDLGCGSAKCDSSYVGIDVLDLPGVDVVGDVHDVLCSLPEASVQEIFSSHFLEHLTDLPDLFEQVERVLVTGGRFRVVVPHFSNPYYYSDPTHHQAFGLYTFSYLAEDQLFRRRVPRYGRRPRLRLEHVELCFRSAAEFPIRMRIKRAIGRVLNTSQWTQEFYEEVLSGILPCYELAIALVKIR